MRHASRRLAWRIRNMWGSDGSVARSEAKSPTDRCESTIPSGFSNAFRLQVPDYIRQALLPIIAHVRAAKPIRQHNHHHVHAYLAYIVAAKCFPQSALYRVPYHCIPAAPGYGHTQTGMSFAIGQITQTQRIAVQHSPLRSECSKISLAAQTQSCGKRLNQEDKRLRPLARRRRKIALPPRVAILARKP